MIAGRVYLITNRINGKKYVGCTIATLKVRWKQHRRLARLGKGAVLHQALRKYGSSSFCIKLLERVKGTHSDLMAAEKKHLELHDCLVPHGYNVTSGGQGLDFSLEAVKSRHAEGIRKRSLKPEWREVLRKRSADPGWRKANAKALHKLHTDPDIRKKQVEGLRRKMADQDYAKEQADRTRKTVSGQVWKEAHTAGVRKLVATQKWQASHEKTLRKAWAGTARKTEDLDKALPAKVLRKKHRRRKSYKEYFERMKKGETPKTGQEIMQTLRHDPSWVKNHSEGVAQRSADPEWRKQIAANREKALEASRTKTKARDALCTPEELARKMKQREAYRRYNEKRKLPQTR